MNTHGNQYQKGLPDKYCVHPKYGQRWIEVKRPGNYSFRASQLKYFPLIDRAKIGIWVLMGYDEEDYKLLFKGANWKEKLRRGDIEKIQNWYPWFRVASED